MIYLFEDREDRKQQFLGSGTNHLLICHKPFDCSDIAVMKDYIKTNYADAKVILLHKSYKFGNQEFTTEIVKNGFKLALGVPVVLFSGGSNSSLIKEGDTITAEINSGVMYHNLNLFADTYQKTGIICIPILVYGRYYRINQLMEMQARINDYLFDRRVYDTIRHGDIRKLKQILNDVTESSLATDINTLRSWIEEKGEKMRIDQLNQAVQNLIKKYQV